MRNSPLFFLAVTTVAWLCLSGFTKPTQSHEARPKTPRLHDNKAVQTLVKKESAASDFKEEKPKPLDLSVPFKETDDTGQTTTDKAVQNGVNNLFAPEQKKTAQAPLQLKGGWLMSQEPEVEKRKSVDGAGIVINVKQ